MVFHSQIIMQQKQNKMMNQQPTFDINTAIGSQINFRSHPNKANFPSRTDLNNLNNELEVRRRIANAKIKANKLRNQLKNDKFQQARLQAKIPIFQKYSGLIEKELQVLKVELQSQNEYDDEYKQFFRFNLCISSTDMSGRLLDFQKKLRQVRKSPCYFKYCCPLQSCCCCVCNWSLMWCTLPFYCCYKGGLKESKCQTRLQQLYERYEQLMVAENEAIACSLNDK